MSKYRISEQDQSNCVEEWDRGNVISPKLFTAALEDDFKMLNWKRQGIKINGKHLSHFNFTDDIVVVTESLENL